MMKDRFKFRAKRIDNNQWYYGCYLFLKNPPEYDWSGKKKESKGDIHFIIDENDINYAIAPQTLGQCTGLNDKNGKLIFEGDIVRVDENLFEIVYEIGSFMIATKTNCASIHQFKGYWNDNVYPLSQLYFEYENEEFTIDNLEIIGNIYENPELLKGGEK